MKKLSIAITILVFLFPLVSCAKTEDQIIKLNPQLKVSSKMVATAKFKVNDMIAHNYFAHTNPFGDSVGDIFTRYKIKYFVAGEILAYGYSGQELINAWLNSPTHKAIIYDKDFKFVGCYSLKGYTACHFYE